MRLIGVTVGVLAALVILFTWVQEPVQEALSPVAASHQGLGEQPVAEGEKGQPADGDDSATEAGVESPPPPGEGAGGEEVVTGQEDSPAAVDPEAVMNAATALVPEAPAAPSEDAQAAAVPMQPVADEVAGPAPAPASGAETETAKDSVTASPPSPTEPLAGASDASNPPDDRPDSVPVVEPISAAPAVTESLPKAHAPASSGLAESAPEGSVDAALDPSLTAQLETDPQTDPTMQWYIFMQPFGSAYKAKGFADYVSHKTGIPMMTVREGVGAYRVALGYHDETELQDRITIIEASTGLDVEGERR